MKLILYLICLILLASCVQWAHEKSSFSNPNSNPDTQSDSIRIKIANYNAGNGLLSTPDRVAQVMLPFNFDIICFNQIPDGDWIKRVGKILGMNYSFVGKVSSANKINNYKGILSKIPFKSTNEYILNCKGWEPASIITVLIRKNSDLFGIYCLQIAGSRGEKGSYAEIIATDLIRRLKDTRIILTGDFDNTPEDKALKLFDDAGMNDVWNDLNINISEQSSLYPDFYGEKGLVDNILYSRTARSHTLKGGFIETVPEISQHKIVWALLEFPPPIIKKNRI